MGDLAPKIDIPGLVAKLAAPAAAAALFAHAPVVGALIASAVTILIPERRMERLTSFAERLDEKVRAIQPSLPPTTFDDDDKLSLFEESVIAASRATSIDRLDYIASLLANGLTANDAKRLDRKYLLSLLNEMNDLEVLLLCLHGRSSMEDSGEFWEKHKDSLEYERASLASPLPVVDREAIRNSYEDHLLRLGVMEEHFIQWNKVASTELDRKGKPKGIQRQLSHLGRVLLREIGQPSDLDGSSQA